MTLAASLAVLIAASSSAGTQPIYEHKAHTEYTALVHDSDSPVTRASHGRGAPTEIFSRNTDQCTDGCFLPDDDRG
jgi:hypothetical protein